MNPILDRPIKDTTLPTRAKTVLKRCEAKTVGDATKLTRSQLLKSKWCGKKVLTYIENYLNELGLSLTDENAVSTEKGFSLLNNFFAMEKQIHEYFGYKEDWVKIPMEDRTEYDWLLIQRQPVDGTLNCSLGKGTVTYGEDMTAEKIADGACYSDSIYTQRFLPKWVYRGEKFTMIVVDTHTDGNKFLAIFDNAKEVTPERFGAEYPRAVAAARRWDSFGDLGTPPDMIEMVGN